MYALILGIHLIVSITMILIIIFQSSKGAEMGAVFGGGASQTAFGSSGPQSFLEKVTVACAVIFMLTSLSLAYMSAVRMKTTARVPQAPIEQPVQSQTPAEMPSAQQEAPTAPSAE